MRTEREQLPAKSSSSRRAYWICQIAGWTAVFLLGTAGAYAFKAYTKMPMSPVIAGTALFCAVGVLVSHLLYTVVRRAGWLQMPMRTAWPRLASATVLAAMPLSATTILANIALIHTIPPRTLLHPKVFLVFWANHLVLMTAWMALYLAANEFRQRRQAEVTALRHELVAQQAQLRGLRAQLNPHFLFNCLNSLRELILENPQSAQRMVTQLSALLRYSLQSNQTEQVALAEEIQAVKDYLDLETVRFEDRLRIHWNVASGVAAAAVPPMLLQTLVENALKHGIARRPEGGEVTIAAWPEDSLVHLEVINNGNLPENPSQNGIGLKNARTRLQLLYGEKGNIVLENISENRVRAAVTLPLRATEAIQ
jgi:two-component system, LytTR family, sensor kinase